MVSDPTLGLPHRRGCGLKKSAQLHFWRRQQPLISHKRDNHLKQSKPTEMNWSKSSLYFLAAIRKVCFIGHD
jgi:hypothetical protein